MDQGSVRGGKAVIRQAPRSMGRASGRTSVTSTRGQRGRPPQRSVVSEPQAEPGPSMFRSQTGFLGGQNRFDNHQGDRTNVTVHIHKSGALQASLDPETEPRTFSSSQDIRNTSTSSEHHPDGNTGITDVPREPQRSNKLYEYHLMQKGRGYPLWIPQADLGLPVPYRAVGPSIGDVGLITPLGSFDFLFNVCRPHNDPINPQELPENFTPIHPPLKASEIRRLREFNSGSYLASSSVAMSQLESQTPEFIFESSAADGAILTMPEGAYQEELRNVEKFRDYIATHAEDWYTFINRTLGCEAQNGDLHLVVGSDKSTSWGMATFVNVSQQRNSRLKFHVLGVNNRTSSGCMSVWEHSGMAEVRSGPDVGENDELGATPDHPLRNQCLFIRTLNISLPVDAWRRANQKSIPVFDDTSTKKPIDAKSNTTSPLISDAAQGGGITPSSQVQGSHGRVGSSENPRQGVLLADILPSPTTVHPSKVINDFLLGQKPEAVVAITHDRDWYNLMNAEDEAFPDSLTLLERISAANDIRLNNGVVYFQLKGPNARERDYKQQELQNLAMDFKTGQMTLHQYLLGDSADYTAQLYKFAVALATTIASSHVYDYPEEIYPSIPLCLIEDRRRPLPLDDLVDLVRGSKQVGDLIEDAISTHPALFSDASDGEFTGSTQARIAFGLHQRYIRSNQIDDLEEAIAIYHDLVTFGSNPHLRLEALLGLAPLLHQRYLIKKLPEDLHSLVQSLKLQGSLDFELILQPVQQDIDAALSSSNQDSVSISKFQTSKNKMATPSRFPSGITVEVGSPKSYPSTPGGSMKDRDKEKDTSSEGMKSGPGSVSIIQRATTALEAAGLVRKKSPGAAGEDRERKQERERERSRDMERLGTSGGEPRSSHGRGSSRLTQSPPTKPSKDHAPPPSTPPPNEPTAHPHHAVQMGPPWMLADGQVSFPQLSCAAVAPVNTKGEMLHSHSTPNFTQPPPVAVPTAPPNLRNRPNLLEAFRLWFNKDRKRKRKEEDASQANVASHAYPRPIPRRGSSSGGKVGRPGSHRAQRRPMSSRRSSSVNSRRSSGISIQTMFIESPLTTGRKSFGAHTPNLERGEQSSRPSSIRSISMQPRHRKSLSQSSAGSIHLRTRKGKRKEDASQANVASHAYPRPIPRRGSSSGGKVRRPGSHRAQRRSMSSRRSSSVNSRRSSGISIQTMLIESPLTTGRKSFGAHTPNSERGEQSSRPSSMRSISMRSISMQPRHRKSLSQSSIGSIHLRTSSPGPKYHRRGGSESSTRVVRQAVVRPPHARSNSTASSISSVHSSRPTPYGGPSKSKGLPRTSSLFKARSWRSTDGSGNGRCGPGASKAFTAQKRTAPFVNPRYGGTISRSSWKKSRGIEPPGWQSRNAHLSIEVLDISTAEPTPIRDVFSGKQANTVGDESDWVDEDDEIPSFAGGLGQVWTPGVLSCPGPVTLSPAPRGHRGHRGAAATKRSARGASSPGGNVIRPKLGLSPAERVLPLSTDAAYGSLETRKTMRQLHAARSGPAFRHAIQEEDQSEEE